MRLLKASRWLTTSQVHRRFFAHASADAARKRLRKLLHAGFLASYRENRMSESFFTLGPEAKRYLEKSGSEEIVLERRIPKQLEHFIGINDLRIAAELSQKMNYFFACWELPSLDWHYPLIPDALFALSQKTFALEYDRGWENVQYFVRKKIPVYRQGLEGLPLAGLLIVTDRRSRMHALSRAIGTDACRPLYAIIDKIREHGIIAPVFQEGLNQHEISIV